MSPNKQCNIFSILKRSMRILFLSSDASAVALIADVALYHLIQTWSKFSLFVFFCLDKKSSREEIQMSSMGPGMKVGKSTANCIVIGLFDLTGCRCCVCQFWIISTSLFCVLTLLPKPGETRSLTSSYILCVLLLLKLYSLRSIL